MQDPRGVASGGLAAFSVDVEPDYGGFFGPVYNALQDEERLAAFKGLLERESVPATLFMTGDLLENHGNLAERMVRIGSEFQAHSHSHPRPGHDVIGEARKVRESFSAFFGRPPSGYRSPYGYMPGSCLPALAELGYRYDSSLFPTFRPGLYCIVHKPLFPVKECNGILELPIGCFKGVRLVFSIGYLKFFGMSTFRFLLRHFGVPGILVIDSHMHDFVPTALYQRLPSASRFRYSMNRDNGLDLLAEIVGILRESGYSFVTVGEIVRHLEAGEAPKDGVHRIRQVTRPLRTASSRSYT